MEKIKHYTVADKKANGKNYDIYRFIPLENIEFLRSCISNLVRFGARIFGLLVG